MAQRTRRKLARQIGIIASLGLMTLTLAGCGAEPLSFASNKWWNFGFPTGVTPESEAIRSFWTFACFMTLVIGVIVWGLIFWPVIFHRRKATDPEFPRQTQYNIPLEVFYTVVPFVLISVLFFFNVLAEDKVLAKAPESDTPVIIDVTAFQWNWKFGYSKVDMGGVKITKPSHDTDNDGLTTEEKIKVDNDVKKKVPEGWLDARNIEATRKIAEGKKDAYYFGYNRVRMPTDIHAEEGAKPQGGIHGNSQTDLSYLAFDKIETVGDSQQPAVLVVPADTRIQFTLNSADVSHGFNVAEFIFQRDVYAHPTANNSDNKIQIEKINHPQSIVGRCSEMCGTYHAFMNFEIRVLSKEDFVRYMEQRLPKNGKQGLGNYEALRAIGQNPLSEKIRPYETGLTGPDRGKPRN